MKFDPNGKHLVYNVDLDGTLTNGELFWEIEPTPSFEIIKTVRKIYAAGNIIIIWTARQWEYAPDVVAWLIKHRVPFHGLYMAKGGADFYVDDKNISVLLFAELGNSQ